MSNPQQLARAIEHLVKSLASREALAREQRFSDRYAMNIPVELCSLKGERLIHLRDTWGLDASRGGLGLLTTDEMELQDDAYVRIHLSRFQDHFFPIRILYCRRLADGIYRLGCVFKNDDNANDSGLLFG